MELYEEHLPYASQNIPNKHHKNYCFNIDNKKAEKERISKYWILAVAFSAFFYCDFTFSSHRIFHDISFLNGPAKVTYFELYIPMVALQTPNQSDEQCWYPPPPPPWKHNPFRINNSFENGRKKKKKKKRLLNLRTKPIVSLI